MSSRITETARNRTKVTINHKQEIAYALSEEIKVIDLG